MITRLLMGALVLGTVACTTPVAETAAPKPWPCRDVVSGAAGQALALANFRDDQRAVILLPAGKAAAEYEAEARRLRSERARLLGLLKSNDPDAGALSRHPTVPPKALSEEKVAALIAAADACVANAAG